MLFKPMKPPAGSLEDHELKLIKFPVICSPKVDGFRCSVQQVDGKPVLLSSTLLPISNLQLQKALSHSLLLGVDGELVAGDPTAIDAFNATSKVVTGRDADASNCKLYVFDYYSPDRGYAARLESLKFFLGGHPFAPKLEILESREITNLPDLIAYEKELLARGYEGMMIRSKWGKYKQGRSTMTEQGLLRRKPFTDGEAIVIGFEEGETNTNPATVNALGRTKRSTAKAGKIKNGTLGNFKVRGLTVFKDVEFNLSAFGTTEESAEVWANQSKYLGKIVKFKYQAHGSLNKPRLPIGIGWRDPIDLVLE